jgi:hypothetical protein
LHPRQWKWQWRNRLQKYRPIRCAKRL